MQKPIIVILLSLPIYSIASHLLLGVDYGDVTQEEKILRSLLVFSSMFLMTTSVPVLIAILVAKIPKSNRKKPLADYVMKGIYFGWALALVGLWAGWYGKSAVEDYKQTDAGKKAYASAKLDLIINDEISSISEQTPIHVNEFISVLSASYEQGLIHIVYQLKTSEIPGWEETESATILSNFSEYFICQNPALETFRTVAPDKTFQLDYIDETEANIESVRMKGADCKNSKTTNDQQ